jgi:enoyl-CoA hydratase
MANYLLVDDPAVGVRRITFNRPESLNAFLSSMYAELLQILNDIGNEPAVRVVVLTGAGRGFCSGHDNVSPEPTSWVSPDVGKTHDTLYYTRVLNAITATIRSLPQPVIAAVNGSTAGIGLTFALACDMIVAAKSAKFVNAFHNAGTGSEAGFSYLLPRAVGVQRAAELLLTARVVLADEAERIGLALKAVPDEQLMPAVLELANAIMVNAPLDIWLTKQNLYQNLGAGSLEQAMSFETRAITMANATQDAQEKRAARREKRAPTFSSK